jgi:hypothetical protein
MIRSQRGTEEHNADDQLAAMRQQMQISGPGKTPQIDALHISQSEIHQEKLS